MRKAILLIVAIINFVACSTTEKMTKEEIQLINNGSAETPYRVLLTTNREDSLLLRKKSTNIDVTKIASDKNLQLFIERLKMTMAVESGVGIAAPQVGLSRKIFLFMRLDKPECPVQVAINPQIINHSDDTFCFERDGCLSIPEISGNSTRYNWVDVEYYNESGQLIKERLYGGERGKDFTGVIFQHENDHLHGILFIDRLCD